MNWIIKWFLQSGFFSYPPLITGTISFNSEAFLGRKEPGLKSEAKHFFVSSSEGTL